MRSFQLDVVSQAEEVYSGPATRLFATGIQGEFEILYGHASFMTSLAPGPMWMTKEDGTEEAFVFFGGMIEVQPEVTTILADVVLYAEDLDENAAIKVKENVEKRISEKADSLDYGKAHSELSLALAQLRILKKLKDTK